jgi:hypothetical protein
MEEHPMNRLEEIYSMIEQFLNGEYEPFEFSGDLQDWLCYYHKEMVAVNPKATEILNRDLPEICDEYEPGMDPKPFMDAVRHEYEEAKKY